MPLLNDDYKKQEKMNGIVYDMSPPPQTTGTEL